MANKYTVEELKMRQSLPLSIKVAMAKTRIREWVNYFGEDGVYIAYSGGKDSTVLSHLVDECFPNNEIPRVFCDTGLEYPEIREFVRKEPRAIFIRPNLTFKQVIEKYGYPFISKIVSHNTNIAKHNPNGKVMKNIFDENKKGRYALFKYSYLLNAPFEISDKCCYVMKKKPSHDYSKRTGRKSMVATMAEESTLRRDNWLHNGCNMFETAEQKSAPMSIWTEQDVLLYIKQNQIEICSVYGEIIPLDDEQVGGQMTIADYVKECGDFDENPKLKTTGCTRTGCMFCGYGCHLEKDGKGRFEMMKETHPKQYDYIMRPKEKGGLDYKNVIDWLNEHGNLNIRY